MRFLADENIPARLVQHLRSAGHEVVQASGSSLTGQPDRVLFQAAKRRAAVLITLDMDFANLQSYPPRHHPGIVVIRTHSQSARVVTEVFIRFLHSKAARVLKGSLVIVQETRARIRRF